MTRDDVAKSLVIVGETESGISWSWWLLSHLAARSSEIEELRARAPGGVEAIQFDLRRGITMPVAERRAALIKAVTNRIEEGRTEEWIAQAARQVSDFKDWCYQRLAGSDRQCWIFVDSIDEQVDVDQNGVGEILAALVDLADDPQTNLRLVLAGRRADTLAHVPLRYAQTDSPVGLSREEVRTWLEARAAQQGLAPQAERVEAFLDHWFTGPTRATRPVELTMALPAAVEEVSA